MATKQTLSDAQYNALQHIATKGKITPNWGLGFCVTKEAGGKYYGSEIREATIIALMKKGFLTGSTITQYGYRRFRSWHTYDTREEAVQDNGGRDYAVKELTFYPSLHVSVKGVAAMKRFMDGITRWNSGRRLWMANFLIALNMWRLKNADELDDPSTVLRNIAQQMKVDDGVRVYADFRYAGKPEIRVHVILQADVDATNIYADREVKITINMGKANISLQGFYNDLSLTPHGLLRVTEYLKAAAQVVEELEATFS